MHSQRMPSVSAIDAFRETVYAHFVRHERDFAWRHTTDPYHILVSEVMLQQTQTSRVVPKYLEFIERFPDFETLARAHVADVLATWQGLGYNRRGRSLHAAAQHVSASFGGRLPSDRDALLSLPGVGSYTAAAVRVFAFGLPDVFIETNIRTVFIHEFFPEGESVRDTDILRLVDATLDRTSPRRWYQALMDYGAKLKESGNPSRRSAHHRPQSRFEGSRRQARGIILRTLLRCGPMSLEALGQHVERWDSRFDDALDSLKNDGLVTVRNSIASIAP